MKKKIKKQLLYLVVIIGMLVFGCVCPVYAGSKISLRNAKVKLSAEKLVYNKKTQRPKVTVTSNSKTLKAKRDYTVKFSGGCKNIGAYTVSITGKGKYTGTLKKQFQIVPQTTQITYLISIKDSTNYMMQVVWKKQTSQTKGYEVRYSTSPKMKNAKKAVIKKKSANSVSIRNLKAGTNYYVQVRTYGTAKGKKYYSKWSSAKSCKTLGGEQSPVPVKTLAPTKAPQPTKTPEPTKIPELKFKTGDENVNLDENTRFKYVTTNEIKSIDISDNTVLYQFGKTFGSECNFESLEPGKSVITFTDIYGQTITSTVKVTEKVMLHDYSSMTATSTVVDNTMPKATIRSTTRSWYYIFLTCSGGAVDTCEGFEGYLSFNSNFDDYIQVKQKVRQSDGTGFWGFEYIPGGQRCYIKVRSYTMRGDVKVVGPWSETYETDMLSVFNPSEEKAKYTYEIYGIDKKQLDFYSGVDKPIYIKTDNPDADAFELRYNDRSALINLQVGNNSHFYKDVVYEGDEYEDSALLKVKGGYLGHLCFDDPGTYTLEIREYSTKGYTVVGNVTINVLDFEQEAMKWMQDIIDKTTTSDMTSFEKMDAIQAYLRTPGLFKYLTNRDDKLVKLAAEPNSPFFISYRWDSATSPSVLCQFAKLIGGFDDIHNCYGDYPFGSAEWQTWHAWAKLTIGQDTRYYIACPVSETGIVDQIDMIDFSNVSNFRKFY